MEDFGVIAIGCNQDCLFAKGTCASIRHFLGDVPICLLVEDVKKRFSINEAAPAVQGDNQNVTHWPAPSRLAKQAQWEPMSFCRRKFLQAPQGATGLKAELAL